MDAESFWELTDIEFWFGLKKVATSVSQKIDTSNFLQLLGSNYKILQNSNFFLYFSLILAVFLSNLIPLRLFQYL